MAIVTTVFERPGPHILAEAGDYTAAQVINDSTVDGDNAEEALDTLKAGLEERIQVGADLGGTPAAPVVLRIQGFDCSNASPTDKDVWQWNAGNARWEPTPEPTSGLAMAPIYEVDFRSLPTQVLNQGTCTIDGLTWYAKCTSVGPFGSFIQTSIVNGEGLRFDQLAGTSTGQHLASGAVDWVYRHMFMPIAQLPDYNPDAPMLFRFHGIMTGADPHMGFVGGLCSSTNDGAGIVAADRQYDYLITANGQTSSQVFQPGIKIANELVLGLLSGRLSEREAGIYRFLGTYEYSVWGPSDSWSGTFGPVDDLAIITPGNPLWQFPSRPNLGVIFGVDGQSDAGPSTITQMQILQPRLP
jgi:hypothetical protein